MSSFEEIISISKVILKKYYLCDHCLGRLFLKKLRLSSEKNLGKKIKSELAISKQRCFICKDLYENTCVYIKKMSQISAGYEFSSFVVGTKIKPSIVDRDDFIRSKFQIRGIDSIKTGITHEISKQFSRKEKKKIDFMDPDVTFTIDIKEELYEIRSKQLFLQGRYSKNIRGLPQKQRPCQNCSGKGCRVCDFHGIDKYESVEGILSKAIFDKLGGTLAKFTWIGGEDKSSLVLGSGRPFFVRLQNPSKRKFKFQKTLKLDSIIIHNLKIISHLPKKPFTFTSHIEILVTTKKEILLSSLKKLQNLTARPIIVYENSGKRSEKQIFEVFFEKKSKNQVRLLIQVEGGFPVKRFVTQENIEPGLSQILGTDCKCEGFDILDVKMTTNN